MSINKHPLHALAAYLPSNSFEHVVQYLHQFKVHLTITRERKSVLGNYRNATRSKNHRISINGNLNPYSFLITLLHELAHLLTYEQYGNRVQAHGKEWKQVYAQVLAIFLTKNIFPKEIVNALQKSLHNPAASSCAEDDLMRVLRMYDKKAGDTMLIEELALQELFITKDGRTFERGEKLRKRYRCKEIKTGSTYLFSPVYEVKKC
ncbi:MAG: SprT-like domain-containing protein [Chitinophagaceae bacterium]|jgi:predicted SprT family Zn-dependent metalloprotease|nr:SprT-like domain-containing protein [Chitinophagaceae bacterium]